MVVVVEWCDDEVVVVVEWCDGGVVKAMVVVDEVVRGCDIDNEKSIILSIPGYLVDY